VHEFRKLCDLQALRRLEILPMRKATFNSPFSSELMLRSHSADGRI